MADEPAQRSLVKAPPCPASAIERTRFHLSSPQGHPTAGVCTTRVSLLLQVICNVAYCVPHFKSELFT